MPTWLTSLPFGTTKTVVVLLLVATLASLDVMGRIRHRNLHLAFACVLGTLLSIGFISFTGMLFSDAMSQNPHMLALGILILYVGWRLLFGPWGAETKAAVLGTAIVWIVLAMLSRENGAERAGHLVAIGVAAIPAAVWAVLFLSYHRERLSVVLLMFFAGMLSTIPILFYDALARRHAEMHFFFFRLVPESFSASSQSFVSGQLAGESAVRVTVVALMLSFLLVGIIEEGSKYWVITRGGARFFHSIDDALQLSIIAAIGFAFAENISQAGYFVNFVRDYLAGPEKDWASFLGNVAGRSILTTMVHVVSTGIMGYFLGLATFAAPCLQEAAARGRPYRFVEYLHELLGFRRTSIFRAEMLLIGFLAAVVLHAFSNFTVTLPDALPSHPKTVADLFGMGDDSFFQHFSLLLIPSLLYVVGGFWVLTLLFAKNENMKERGYVVTTESFVPESDESDA